MATTTGQVFRNKESVGAITKTGANTAQLAVSTLTLGGLQYTTDAVKSLDMTTSGVGGLDTGAVAAFKTYNVFTVVSGSDIALIASLSTIPSGYTTYNNIGTLKTIAAGVISEGQGIDLGSVGDSKYSMLTEVAFIAQNGGGWVLSDGRDVTGSSYAPLTGNTTVPDARGQFLRGKNNGRIDGQENPDGDVVLGTQQTDAIQGHKHNYTRSWLGANNFMHHPNTSVGLATGADNPVVTSGNGVTDPVDDGSNGVPRTGLETRSKNITVNTFIKINN